MSFSPKRHKKAKKVEKELKNLIQVLEEGDFPAQKIVSNNPQVLKNLEEDQKGPTDVHKIYGQKWDIANDQLTLNFKKEKLAFRIMSHCFNFSI